MSHIEDRCPSQNMSKPVFPSWWNHEEGHGLEDPLDLFNHLYDNGKIGFRFSAAFKCLQGSFNSVVVQDKRQR